MTELNRRCLDAAITWLYATEAIERGNRDAAEAACNAAIIAEADYNALLDKDDKSNSAGQLAEAFLLKFHQPLGVRAAIPKWIVVTQLAAKHLGEGSMVGSARLCLAEALNAEHRKDYDAQLMWARKSLAYSIGISHPDYQKVS